MAYVKVEYTGEFIYDVIPVGRGNVAKVVKIKLPKGSIKKLIGRELKWEDEAVELKK